MGKFSVEHLKESGQYKVLAKQAERARRLATAERYARARSAPVRTGTVLYESFSGNGMLCNPEAIFRHLLGDPQYRHLRHVWALSSLEEHAGTVAEFAEDPRVSFVETGSAAYLEAMAEAQYLVNNSTFPWTFAKRPGQVYLNTWHGTPLKAMGYHVPDGGPDTRNIIRNFVQADYLLSPNPFTTEQMYYAGYKLRNIFEGTIIQAGYPRIDHQWPDAPARADLWTRLAAAGIAEDGRRIILYAPTWKGDSFYNPANDAARLLHTVRALEERIDTTRFRVLLKIHQVVYAAARQTPGLEGYLVPNAVPANRVLGITDVLVTDYSSIFYDFLATGRPILFYTPDWEDYAEGRGLYRNPDSLPGPVARTLPDLAAHLAGCVRQSDGGLEVPEPWRRQYGQDVRDYVPDDDGKATERVVEAVFGQEARLPSGARPDLEKRSAQGSSAQGPSAQGAGLEERHLLRDHSDGRQKLLVYAGGLVSNGITTSFLNLMENIDHEKFDVSVWYSYSSHADRAANALRINPNVRLFPRAGGPILGLADRFRYRRTLDHGPAPGADFRAGAQPIWDTEWTRCFGQSRFDYIVDFSGYSPFWSLVLLRGKARKHSIWAHNDLFAEAGKVINGKQPHRAHLMSLFATYRSFDAIVSVSPGLARVNATNLAEYAPAHSFVSARNSLAYRRLQAMVSTERTPLPGADAAFAELYGSGSRDLSYIMRTLRRIYTDATIDAELGHQRTLDAFFPEGHQDGVQTFVTVGRLSPEKNQARLLRAFAQVHATRPKTRLLVIGSGPLEKDLRQLASDLRLDRCVSFTGQLANPYLVMEAADCFVLSSDYEGLPMVILEAMVLGLPVVTTAFGSVESAVPPGQGLVVERDDDALAAGLLAFLDGKVAPAEFDPAAYNDRAMEEFYRAIGVAGNPVVEDGRLLEG
ncbi:hypothetical protein NCCP1664_02040 [Zafaria cholistanensis]|uniref:Glycosyl transferase family 1 domain-containing protein n=1 Tax=Zafaria cholistanensis TaxID=1682741 RepID=A0A5A7NNT3_9MICC|nr:glycosyltransferase [Zafaria cholistanensis]GER21707.1 hypothetical protein NCCP1664_02040 [Zafaria cholistanensis]